LQPRAGKRCAWFFSAGFAYVSAARGAIMMATMPMQTLLLAALLGRERFDVLLFNEPFVPLAAFSFLNSQDARKPAFIAWLPRFLVSVSLKR
jgi:drug/metabolite transporter (DMT)-like permease